MHPQSTAQQQTTTDTAQQRWYFTFGSGQQNDGKYVVIPGSYDEARDVMLAHFGNAWSFQYASPERAGVEEFGLVELPRAEWPTPAHRHAGGWKGGPGECGVYCACGVTYDGFDSLGEATELLDRHIAEESKPAAPDYWLTLADDLRQAADRVATLTGTPKPKNGARLVFHCGVNDRDHETTRPVVDAVAALFDATTKATPSGGSLRYDADGKVGELKVWPWAYIPAPEDPEKAAMRAELDALRAQLAEGGATR